MIVELDTEYPYIHRYYLYPMLFDGYSRMMNLILVFRQTEEQGQRTIHVEIHKSCEFHGQKKNIHTIDGLISFSVRIALIVMRRASAFFTIDCTLDACI